MSGAERPPCPACGEHDCPGPCIECGMYAVCAGEEHDVDCVIAFGDWFDEFDPEEP